MTAKRPNASRNIQILEEAADWLVRFSEGEADGNARQRFAAWLRASPEHVRAYLELLPVWENGATDRSPQAGAEVDALVAWARAGDNVVPLSLAEGGRSPAALPGAVPAAGGARRHPHDHRRRRLWAASAALGLVITGALAWCYSVQASTYVTQVGEQRSLVLHDGTTITLNACSKVRVRYSAHERRVDLLQGQALFSVAKDAARPFFVRTDSTQVRAVGTEFDVYRKPAGMTTVTVIEGTVAVTPFAASPLGIAEPDSGPPTVPEARNRNVARDHRPQDQSEPIVVTAGEQVTVRQSARAIAESANIAVATAWTQHRLVFDASTLGEVVAEFNRYNPRPLILRDPALANFPITAVFSSTDPTSLVRFLEKQPGIGVSAGSDEIQIFSVQ